MRFAYGADCAALEEGRIAATQTLSGTGACRIAGEFYKRYLPEGTQVYLPDPTWGNHVAIMQEAGLEVRARARARARARPSACRVVPEATTLPVFA